MKEETQDKIKRSIKDFVSILRKIRFHQLDPPLIPIYFQYFGSFMNGFGTESSDVDFTILTNCYVDEAKTLRFMNQELDIILKKQQRFEIKTFAEGARIPVLKMKDNKEDVEYDVCCNNILGAINSKLLNEYSNLHEYVRKGGILLKIWGKNVGIITQNNFSSYAIIVMWISFLQNKYNLPNLQDQNYHQSIKSDYLHIKRKTKSSLESPDQDFLTRVTFIVDQEEQRRRMENCTISQHNLSDLLFEFWDYYKLGGTHATNKQKIAIHLNQDKKNKNRQYRHIYEIEDPFDIPHDPGHRVESLENTSSEILKNFEEAMSQLHGNCKELFEVKKGKN